MVTFIVIVIILAALGILGAVVEGLLWLTAIAVALVVGALVFGWMRLRS